MKRVLYTMLRVGDLERSVDFYTKVLGMTVMSTFDNPEDRYTLKFLGFEEDSASPTLELTYNYGVSGYEMGSAYGHMAIAVDNCRKTCETMKALGATVTLEPKRMEALDEVIAFVRDPDGYQIELIQSPMD